MSVLFQAWRLPSWRASLLSTVSIPHSSPSSRISSWALLTRWSRVNQSDLSAAISYDDSDKLPELHGADQLRSAPTLPCLQNCIENRCFFSFFFFKMSRYVCCPQHHGGNRVSAAGPRVGLQSLQSDSECYSRGHGPDE